MTCRRHSKLDKWQTGERQPTLKQLEGFAKRTMTPLGYLFLNSPPEETWAFPIFARWATGPSDGPART